jgi:putative acetyltransferase
MFTVREEIPADVAAIREVNRAAFGGDDEARLVDLLRSSDCVLASLVAVAGDRVIGHILFSPLVIETPEGERAAAALAPMAVLPEWQRRGVGSALVRFGLDACRRQGIGAVIVVGHPEYYPRLGFSAALARNLQSPYPELGDAWMALELTPGALSGVSGRVRYPEAFAALG